MIRYQLKCSREHEFEAWFLNSATYDTQNQQGDIDCPVCGDSEIRKAPMAPHLGASSTHTTTVGSSEDPETRAREVAEQILKAAGRLRNDIQENCDYVGDKFADEARAIHYGDADERAIYGETTEKEASELNEEGIEVYRVPGVVRRRD